jgi:hypothetical protein
MSRLNYFEPFQSKTAWHEDQLTRAYLVVLRYSPTSLLMFYELISKSVSGLPSISEIKLDDLRFDTQKTDIDNYLASKVLSVLLTDEKFVPENEVVGSDRRARYDGIIRFSDELLVLIENKPKSSDVWEGQLSPNLKNQENEIELLPKPAVVEWKQIIKTLNSLISLHSIGGGEKTIIDDFLDYVNRNFSFLNPYDKLALCKTDFYLIQQRLKSILEEIPKSGEVIYQPKWKKFYLETGLEEIRMVIFEVKPSENDEKYELHISLYFADTQTQARRFYKNRIPYQRIAELEAANWTSRPSFHISYMQTSIIEFETSAVSNQDYYEYWLKHQHEISQRKKEQLSEFFKKLGDSGIIVFDGTKQNELNDKVMNTGRNRLNLCPGFVLSYSIESIDAIEMDKKDELADFIKRKLIEGLSLLDKELLFLR